ncbi:patatin-like phospholipase family protein [Hoyosella subflava]|uniref:PNPLA domain-containing protein n=1 Tax=Hoyosella subflava (strain DSM 45089 / JCM 17490 / NBRC 109087 / DQS3-9A1) TaxID=443218 RepID=F6EPW1_HOYSD|nr:patatin-like phospholipase family protein [Hoyosella subflava]AEF40590.1 hypothetical protein AS9A_2141 [Hoyosella subflava DQS3-9A1]
MVFDSPEALSVASVLDARRTAGTTAATRDDPHRVALVIEGGGARGAYSGGMVAALEELGFSSSFDAVFGTSAGALNAAWFLTGRASEAMWTWWDPRVVKRVVDPSRLLTRGRAFDTAHLVDTVYRSIAPMDFHAIIHNPTSFHPIATALDDGRAADLNAMLTGPELIRTALRATCALPLVGGPPVVVGDREFFDGGLAEPVPVASARRWGATHVLVLRTRSAAHAVVRGSRFSQAVEHLVVTGYLAARSPQSIESWRGRKLRAIELERHMSCGSPAAVQVRPPEGAPLVSTVERRESVLRRSVEVGREAVRNYFARESVSR